MFFIIQTSYTSKIFGSTNCNTIMKTRFFMVNLVYSVPNSHETLQKTLYKRLIKGIQSNVVLHQTRKDSIILSSSFMYVHVVRFTFGLQTIYITIVYKCFITSVLYGTIEKTASGWISYVC